MDTKDGVINIKGVKSEQQDVKLTSEHEMLPRRWPNIFNIFFSYIITMFYIKVGLHVCTV